MDLLEEVNLITNAEKFKEFDKISPRLSEIVQLLETVKKAQKSGK